MLEYIVFIIYGVLLYILMVYILDYIYISTHYGIPLSFNNAVSHGVLLYLFMVYLLNYIYINIYYGVPLSFNNVVSYFM